MEGPLRLKVSVGLQSQAEPGTRVRKEVAWGEHPSQRQQGEEVPARGGEKGLNTLFRYLPNQEFTL